MRALPTSVAVAAGIMGLISGLILGYMHGGWEGLLLALGVGTGITGTAASHSVIGTGGTKKNP